MNNYRTAFVLAIGIAIEMTAVASAGHVQAARQFRQDAQAMHACNQVLAPVAWMFTAPRPTATPVAPRPLPHEQTFQI